MKTIATALLASCVLAQAPPSFAQATLYASSAVTPVARITAVAELPAVAPAAGRAATDRTDRKQKITLTKDFDRRFDVDDVGELELDNRHGDIDYRVVAGNEVRITVAVKATAGSEKKARAMLDKIDVKMSGTRTRVSAKTDVGGAGNAKIVIRNNDQKRGFEIDYTVYAPPGFRLELENDFGDVHLGDMTAAADLDIGYGDLEAGDLGAGSKLEIGFGDARIGYAPDLDADVRYGELDIEGAGVAKVKARFSELELGRFGELEMDSQYGRYVVQSATTFRAEGGFNTLRIDSAERLAVEGNYNDVKVGYLAESGHFDVGFGDVHVASTSAALTSVDFEGSYTDVTLVMADGLDYVLDAKTSYGGISYPSGLTTSREVSRGTTDEVEARRGDGGRARLTLNGSFGKMVVR